MRKKNRKADREISLFPDYDEYVSRVEAEKKRQREKAEQQAKWNEQCDQFISWLFDDQPAGQRGAEQIITIEVKKV